MHKKSHIFIFPDYQSNIFYTPIQNDILNSFRNFGYSYKVFPTGKRTMSDKVINEITSLLNTKELLRLEACINSALKFDTLSIKSFNSQNPPIRLNSKQLKDYRYGLVNYYLDVNEFL